MITIRMARIPACYAFHGIQPTFGPIGLVKGESGTAKLGLAASES